MNRDQFKTMLRPSVAVLLMLALAGCASTPPPDAAMNQAQAMLSDARQAGALDYAPLDFNAAQNRFQQAQAAIIDHRYDVAATLADEASSAAEVARAKARLGAARAQIQSKTAANEQLRQQMETAHPDAGTSDTAPSDSSMPPPTEMPAPAASMLSAPPQQGQGFQTVPDPANTPNQGGQL